MKFNLFLPCRSGSQRIKNKNTRVFGHYSFGLLEHKLLQFSKMECVDSLTVDTDDELIIDFLSEFKSNFKYPVHVCRRPSALAKADSLDNYLQYIPTIMPEGIIFWTHVTSPFFNEFEMETVINLFKEKCINAEYDSLMSVNKIQTFLWNNTGCISHDRDFIKWPQTQDLQAIYEVNSAAFLIDKNKMMEIKDRIGDNPYLYVSSKLGAIDVDWPEDFVFAEKLLRTNF
ncbi:acylneuraminate cytidylyltransferase family protein [Acinetobacter sp. YIM 103518]|uniref:Acylneuraminate cytidylyltransferase family protein n=1 Tax=Acinetobacter faecalis TaxID=2665161 RepID=A0A6L6GFB5_9GAMM|nr:acylneuraminate cytidylyltransferase family protein [Acinetobacter faecalis]MTD11290.1 acylneuraminate cytidylyltransferase family protein [Acinetobacter faecalis]